MTFLLAAAAAAAVPAPSKPRRSSTRIRLLCESLLPHALLLSLYREVQPPDILRLHLRTMENLAKHIAKKREMNNMNNGSESNRMYDEFCRRF